MQEQTLSHSSWLDQALDVGAFAGVEFYELNGAPVDKSGVAALQGSCALLGIARDAVRRWRSPMIPYVIFRLRNSKDVLEWSAEYWSEVQGDRCALELSENGQIFYWGAWESHHQTISLPIEGYEELAAVFRCCKGFYNGEPWEEYENLIYIFAPDDVAQG